MSVQPRYQLRKVGKVILFHNFATFGNVHDALEKRGRCGWAFCMPRYVGWAQGGRGGVVQVRWISPLGYTGVAVSLVRGDFSFFGDNPCG